jgi:periplasmic divalent cation tolerance protein
MGKSLKRNSPSTVPSRARSRSAFSKKSPPAKFLIVLTTAPDGSTARRLATLLVRERLAACVNVVGGVQSVYRWKGAVESAREYLLIAKTTRLRFADLQARLVATHPYAVPEIVALPLAGGLAEYLSWISENTTPSPNKARSQ